MRYFLEPPLCIGTRHVVVISRIETCHHEFCSTHLFHGEKAPVFFLLLAKDTIEILNVSGSKVARGDVERVCPEVAAVAFEILNDN